MRCFIFYVHQFKLTVANHFSLAFVCGQLKLLRRVRVLQSTCLFMKPFENDVLSFNSLHIMCSNSDILALNFFKKKCSNSFVHLRRRKQKNNFVLTSSLFKLSSIAFLFAFPSHCNFSANWILTHFREDVQDDKAMQMWVFHVKNMQMVTLIMTTSCTWTKYE